MTQFRLRTLMIVVALGPMVLAVLYFTAKAYTARPSFVKEVHLPPPNGLGR